MTQISSAFRSKGSSDARLYQMWTCPLHSHCYSAEHLTIKQVRERAASCGEKCRCWLHAVIRIVDNERPDRIKKRG